ncbi:MAG TPA: diacylglycerol kinase family protein [Chloroflexota bacterium]|nr:diacylglycerol kinase family protein [Chloroflexota bacterium]
MSYLGRILKSFRFAWRGIHHLFRTQTNFWVHCAVAVGAVALGVALRASPTELAVLILAIGLVLVAEALNTALEALVDLASPRYHELARVAKDVAAAGVLMAALAAAVVGLVVLGPLLLAALLSS